MGAFSLIVVINLLNRFGMNSHYMSKSASGQGAVEISLEPEFKGISSLLADITKYRIINEKDGLAAMKISRALFQAFLKYRLTESKARELNNEEEATLKRVLSYLIEIEEGRIPQLNLSDRTKKSSKSIQTEPERQSETRNRFGAEPYDHRDHSRNSRGYDAAVHLDAPKDEFFMGHHSRHRARSRSPSPAIGRGKRSASPSWRREEERQEAYLAKSRREEDLPRSEEFYARQMRERERMSEYSRPTSDPRDLEPQDFGERRSGVSGGRKRDDVKSVKIIHGCKVTRLVRVTGDDMHSSRGRAGAMDYMSEMVQQESRNPSNDSFTMKVKTVPTLSQARNVAATKLGLYSDMVKNASYRK